MATDEEVALFLEHFGVKGMHWGVTKERTPEEQAAHDKNVKTAKIVLGSVAAAALITAGAVYVAKNGGLPAHSFSPAAKSSGAKFAKEFVNPKEEPTSVVHFSRGKHVGGTFLQRGGLVNMIAEHEKSGLGDFGSVSPGTYGRYGKNNEKIAVSFLDPKGRRDFAGRPITHQVVLPASHAAGIDNFEDAKKKAWDLTSAQYEDFWNSSLKNSL